MEQNLRFEILGPLRVTAGTATVPVVASRERTLLAMLLLHPNHTVSHGQLVSAVWATEPPRGARGQLHGCISRLRRLTDTAAGRVIATDPGGYRATVAPDQLDLLQFRWSVAQAREANAAGNRTEAINGYRAGLALWHGPALADIDSDPIRHAAAALDEEHAQALQERIDLELADGAGPLVAELTDLVGRHPHREGLHRALMLALYRTGRQADALAAYRRARKLLHDELGIEPGAELRHLHQAILNRDPTLDIPGKPAHPPSVNGDRTPVPRELPADVAGFTGRTDALKTLDELLAAAPDGAPAPVVISAIAGTAGVGKTALAVHWAHRVADQFPDGQLYINLRGYTTGAPVRPIDALHAFLRSLGVKAQEIPAEEAEAAGRYRSELAGRRVLVILDNAGSVEQVRPLLPGTAGCMVLVTSRHRLAGLAARNGARSLTVDVFTPHEAHELLTRLLGDKWVADEPQAVTELAQACAYLPLAVRIAAAVLLDRPDRSIDGYVAELHTGDRLAMLQVDDDEATALSAVFDLSYQRLRPEARRLFRLLGLVPGTDVTAPAVAALGDITEDQAQDLLARLTGAHLVEQHVPGRYTFHDLLRVYARRLVERDESEPTRAEAVQRLFGWYVSGAATAAELLYPDVLRLPIPAGWGEGGRQSGRAAESEPLAWLNAERRNLIAAIEYAANNEPHTPAWLLTSCLYGYFWYHGYTVEWLKVAEFSLSAAERENAQEAQAAMKWNLAGAHRALGRSAQATDDLVEAAKLARHSKWDAGEAYALTNLGVVYIVVGRLTEASGCLSLALDLARRAGIRATEAQILGGLGYLSKQAGRLHEAADYCAQCLTIYRQLSPTEDHNTVRALSNLAHIEHGLGYLQEAGEKLTATLALHRDAGRRLGEVNTLIALAEVRADIGDLHSARETVETALSLASHMANPRKVGEATETLGRVLLFAGRPNEAIGCYRRALELARHNDDANSHFLALHGLAAARSRLAQYEEADEHAAESWSLATKIGYQIFEGLAMAILAEIRLGQRRYDEAWDLAWRALGSHRESGYRLGEARALVLLGQIANATDGPEGAWPHWRAARELFAAVGACEPPDVFRGGSSL